MKQVVFAVLLMAMASLTGCLNGDDSPVDENIDTTDDSTSDTTEDTKDDELIEPVGTNGDTIPANSSIHIDNPYHYRQDHWEEPPKSPDFGIWECVGENEDRECELVYHENDYFDADDAIYYDSDGIRNAFEFNGWVNKTGQTVTIEAMHFPYRESYLINKSENGQPVVDGSLLGRPLTNYCTSKSDYCEITFYGNGGLTTNGFIRLSTVLQYSYGFDSNGDGTNDTSHWGSFYEPITATFDLPFEPYGFSLKYDGYETIDRVF